MDTTGRSSWLAGGWLGLVEKKQGPAATCATKPSQSHMARALSSLAAVSGHKAEGQPRSPSLRGSAESRMAANQAAPSPCHKANSQQPAQPYRKCLCPPPHAAASISLRVLLLFALRHQFDDYLVFGVCHLPQVFLRAPEGGQRQQESGENLPTRFGKTLSASFPRSPRPLRPKPLLPAAAQDHGAVFKAEEAGPEDPRAPGGVYAPGNTAGAGPAGTTSPCFPARPGTSIHGVCWYAHLPGAGSDVGNACQIPPQHYPHADAAPRLPERDEFEAFARHLQDAAIHIQQQTLKPKHSSVSVLMLRWEEDTSVEQDLLALERVFRERYHYQTDRWAIPTVPNPSTKLGVRMASFLDNARPDHLLVIYYAGHGYVGPDNQLFWARWVAPGVPVRAVLSGLTTAA